MTITTSPATPEAIKLDGRSKHLRRVIIRTLAAGKRGHVGGAFSLVEILRALYDHILRFDPRHPNWPDRDRFVLSKGHGCLALYAILADKGFLPETELDKFCATDGILGGHPEFGKVPGVEASTGSLGHGFSFAVGFALNARIDRRQHRVFALLGDGECGEGTIWEAALCAAKHKLENLTVLIDYNKQQTYGSTEEVVGLEPLAAKWAAFGFAVREVNGHNVAALKSTLATLPFEPGKPGALICHTVKGKGIPLTERNLKWHHKAKVTDAEVESLLNALES